MVVLRLRRGEEKRMVVRFETRVVRLRFVDSRATCVCSLVEFSLSLPPEFEEATEFVNSS